MTLSNSTWNLLRMSWLAVSSCVLLITLFFVESKPDIEIFFIYALGALAWPISIVWVMLIGGLYAVLHEAWGIIVPGGRFSVTLGGLGFILLGYIQWFVVVPALIRKVRGSQARP